MTPEDIIRDAQLPTGSVPICMRADLVAEHERLDRELAQALGRPADSLGGGAAPELAARIQALEADMAESTVEFVMHGLPRRAYNRLREQHPAEDKTLLFDADTFFPALIRACTSSPELSDETWRVLFGDSDEERERLRAEGKGDEVEEGKLTDRQFDQLAETALALNRRDVDVPFSRRASRVMQSGEPE